MPSVLYRLERDRNFLRLLISIFISVLGDGAYFIVLGWFVLNVTGSEFALGTTLTFASIPRIVFMLIGGAMADRFDRKRILVLSLISRAVFLAAFVTLLIFMHGKPSLWMIDVIAVLFGTIDAFFYPAYNSMIPSVVPKNVLDRANSLVQTVQQISTVLGPLLAAGLLWFHTFSVMFIVIAGLFALSSMMLSFLRLHQEEDDTGNAEAEASASMWRSIEEGIRFVMTVRILLMVMVVALGINLLFMGPINIGIPILVKSHGWSGSIYGTYESGFGIGTVIGGVLVAIMRGFRGKFLWLGWLGALMGLAMAAIGFVPFVWGGIGLMGIMGIMVSVVNIPLITYIQTIVPSDKLGRTMSLLTLMSVGLVPVSYTASSFLLQQKVMSDRSLLFWCGLAMAALFFALYFFKEFRVMESNPMWRKKLNGGVNEHGEGAFDRI